MTPEDLQGVAEMRGAMAVEFGDGNDPSTAIGTANATADFEEGTLSGTATEFGEYQLSDACEADVSACGDEEKLQDLGGTLEIDGDIQDVDFTYDATGQLTAVDPETGEDVTGDFALNGNGSFGELDGAIVAEGEHAGTVNFGDGQEGASGELILEEVN